MAAFAGSGWRSAQAYEDCGKAAHYSRRPAPHYRLTTACKSGGPDVQREAMATTALAYRQIAAAAATLSDSSPPGCAIRAA